MHHFIYPSQDSFITDISSSNFIVRNFGLDEILKVGTEVNNISYFSPTSTAQYGTQSVAGWCVTSYTGLIGNGTLTGSATTVTGTASFVTGSAVGNPNISTSYSGSLTGFTGSLVVFNGRLSNFTGRIVTASIAGQATVAYPKEIITSSFKSNRALLQFDISAISASIASGDIVNPRFKLKLKVARAETLPIQYTLTAAPLAESWVMGNGYYWDGGSETGVNWKYRDKNNGTAWTQPGGTISSPIASQTFNYESGDVSMDVTNIVNGWISGGVTNNGFLVQSSDELSPTGSGMTLYFFSNDSNTIYRPVLDAAWDDSTYITNTLSTGSVVVSSIPPEISTIVTSGSTFNFSGGLSGSFRSDAIITKADYYVIASGSNLNGTYLNFLGNFTGSFSGTANVFGLFTGSGEFSASYFLGLLDGMPTMAMNSLISASNIQGLITSSTTMQTAFGEFKGTLTSSNVNLYGTASGIYLSTSHNSFSGFVVGSGSSGTINGLPILGNAAGLITIQSYTFTGSCGQSFSGPSVVGLLTSGIFSGSTFDGYLIDGKIVASLSGSWTEASLLGSSVTIPIPSGIEPYAYAYVVGPFINGQAIGTYITSISSSQSSASFDGEFINGNLRGGHLSVQLTGSVITSSYYYTSSITIISSSLEPVQFNRPFVTVVQNLPPIAKAGNIIRVNVFGREEFPLKNFARNTQFSQFLTPKYLPVSSSYAIKDNQTEEIVMDFDNYTRLSCDMNGNYFLLDTTGLPQERYFKILIKTEQSNSVYTMDNGNIFKIVR